MHGVNSFEQVDFTLSDVMDGDIPNSKVTDGDGKIPSKYVDLQVTLTTTAMVKMTVYVPTKAGNVTVDGEVTTVKAGQVRSECQG